MDLSHFRDSARNNRQPIVQGFSGNTHCVPTHILASKLLFNCLCVGAVAMADEKDRFGETIEAKEQVGVTGRNVS